MEAQENSTEDNHSKTIANSTQFSITLCSAIRSWKKFISYHGVTKTDFAIVGSIATAIGFAWMNILYLVFWQFTDFSLLSVQSILGAVWLALPTVTLYLLAKTLDTFEDKISKCLSEHPSIGWIVSVLFLVFIMCSIFPNILLLILKLILSTQSINNIQSILRDHQALFITSMFYIMCTIAVTGLINILKIDEERKKNAFCNKLFFVYHLVFSTVLIILLVIVIAAAIPSSLGGLDPHSETIWVSRGGLDIIAPYNKSAKNQLKETEKLEINKRPEFYPVPNMYLIHENASYKYIQSNDDTVVIRIPNDLIKGEDWLGIDKSKKQIAKGTNLQSQPAQIEQRSETKTQTTSITNPAPSGSVTIDTTTITTTTTAVPTQKTQ